MEGGQEWRVDRNEGRKMHWKRNEEMKLEKE